MDAPRESQTARSGEPRAIPDRTALERAVSEVLLAREGLGAPALPAGAVERLATHAFRVLEANARMNLTRIVEAQDVAVKHVLDSVLVADLVDLRKARVLDVGTGAGYPGLPIAVAVPSASVLCLDGTEKKARFVSEVIEELHLTNAAARAGRAEVLLRDEAFDFLVARAVGPLDQLLPLLLARRDRFDVLVAMKGPTAQEEWERAHRGGATRGFELLASFAYELPGGAGARTLLLVGPSGRRRLKPASRASSDARGPQGGVEGMPRPRPRPGGDADAASGG